MDINLELYKVFYYVATTLSFSEASRQLFISQSAVSQSIKTLEKKLNHPLFIRSTKKVLLTPEGELLLQHVKPALQLLDEGESLLSGDNLLKGQLRIAASDTICRYFLIDYLQKFHQTYPDVRIKVTNSTSIGCAELLEKGSGRSDCMQLSQFQTWQSFSDTCAKRIPRCIRCQYGLLSCTHCSDRTAGASELSNPDAFPQKYHQRISAGSIYSP